MKGSGFTLRVIYVVVGRVSTFILFHPKKKITKASVFGFHNYIDYQRSDQPSALIIEETFYLNFIVGGRR